ncbi:alpha/beta fold hydrolase [Tenacibaculum sp. SG-28]|uniref:alpha/beta fold hydrolase n=1 Tax=Tenacibaculum sp. SG-28 TaxID=754426 RepID=UPI000CF45C9C|nr:alpha/beta hydrolase [Tenacibaculum sp. SG-28]
MKQLVLRFLFISMFFYALPTSAEQLQANTNSKIPSNAIQVKTMGEGDPILCFPGFTVSGDIWENTIKTLHLNKKAHLFSYAGFNGIPAINTPWYEQIKTAIIAYVKDNSLNNITLIGHSMGGNLAIDIATIFPNKVIKMILIDTLPCMREVMLPNVPIEALTYDSPYNKKMLEMNTETYENTAKMMASNMTYTEKKTQQIASWILAADRKTWVYGYTDLLHLDQRPILNKVSCKTLILAASFPNPNTVKQTFEKQYKNLRNSTLKQANNSKHFIMYDAPEWMHSEIQKFIENEEK